VSVRSSVNPSRFQIFTVWSEEAVARSLQEHGTASGNSTAGTAQSDSTVLGCYTSQVVYCT